MIMLTKINRRVSSRRNKFYVKNHIDLLMRNIMSLLNEKHTCLLVIYNKSIYIIYHLSIIINLIKNMLQILLRILKMKLFLNVQ